MGFLPISSPLYRMRLLTSLAQMMPDLPRREPRMGSGWAVDLGLCIIRTALAHVGE